MRLAARPPHVIPRELFTETALDRIATSKYLDVLPLYRQATLLGHFGGADISRNTVGHARASVAEATTTPCRRSAPWLGVAGARRP